MKLNDLIALLKKSGLPVAYHHFVKAQVPPFLVVFHTGIEAVKADNRTYSSFENYNIELYTDKKDISLENKVKALLDGADIEYDCAETYIDSEKLFEVIFEITI